MDNEIKITPNIRGTTFFGRDKIFKRVEKKEEK
jgi:hypothetical protein